MVRGRRRGHAAAVPAPAGGQARQDGSDEAEAGPEAHDATLRLKVLTIV